jgi:hypothetical protein
MTGLAFPLRWMMCGGMLVTGKDVSSDIGFTKLKSFPQKTLV